MKIKLNSKELIDSARKKALKWTYRIEEGIHTLILKALGTYSREKTCGSISTDGRYLISWSWKGLIYLITLRDLCPPVVVSFNFDPECRIKPWAVRFSKDMQQIIIFHGNDSKTLLSAVPAEGFRRRQFPIIQDWISDVPHSSPDNIVEYISQTSSAYWKRIDPPNAKTGLKLPTPFICPPPKDLDCDWEHWVKHGDRYLDIPRNTCEADG